MTVEHCHAGRRCAPLITAVKRDQLDCIGRGQHVSEHQDEESRYEPTEPWPSRCAKQRQAQQRSQENLCVPGTWTISSTMSIDVADNGSISQGKHEQNAVRKGDPFSAGM